MATESENAAWWLRVALGDLLGARASLAEADVPPRHAAFLAHQAAEKALKAVVMWEGGEPPWTHDLVGVRTRAPDKVRAATLQLDIVSLSAAAVSARYPDHDDPPYDHDEVDRLVETAATIVEAARAYLEAEGLGPTEPA